MEPIQTPNDDFMETSLTQIENIKITEMIRIENSIFEKIGIVGEHILSLLVFFVMISSQWQRALSICILGSSTSGKSTIVSKILQHLIPPEWLSDISATTLTEAAFSRAGNDGVKNKIIYADERVCRSAVSASGTDV